MKGPSNEYNQENGDDQSPDQQMADNNINDEDQAKIDNDHEDSTGQDYDADMEWLDIDHLIRLSSDSERDDDEDFYNRFQESTEQNSNQNEDPLAKDVHRLVNVINNVIRSHSNIDSDASRIVNYLDFDIFNYDDILAEVRSWNVGAEALIEESMSSLALDSSNAP